MILSLLYYFIPVYIVCIFRIRDIIIIVLLCVGRIDFRPYNAEEGSQVVAGGRRSVV